MIKHYIECEMCNKQHEIAFLYKSALWRELPAEWFSLFSSDVSVDGWHFCTEKCLTQWTTGNIAQEEVNKPQSKIRRFVMQNAEKNDFPVEGVVWSDGRVKLDNNAPHCVSPNYHNNGYYHCSGTFESIDLFEENHPGYVITWIDKEK